MNFFGCFHPLFEGKKRFYFYSTLYQWEWYQKSPEWNEWRKNNKIIYHIILSILISYLTIFCITDINKIIKTERSHSLTNVIVNNFLIIIFKICKLPEDFSRAKIMVPDAMSAWIMLGIDQKNSQYSCNWI